MRELHVFKTIGWCVLVLGAAAFVAGCDSGSSGTGAAPEVTLDVSSVSINVSETDEITATSTNGSDTSFIWTVDVPGAVSITSVDTVDVGAKTLTSVATVTGIYAGAVTITATADPSGLFAEVAVTVTATVGDTEPPVAVCQSFLIVDLYSEGLPGTATITAADVDAGSTDNVGIVSRTVTPDTFTCADLGSIQVTLTVSDAAGNTDSCVTTVTVQDPGNSCNAAPVVRMSAEGLSSHDINDLDFAGAGLDPATFNQSSALTNVPVGAYAYFTANATDSEDDPLTYTWVVTAPDASDVPTADLPDTGDDQAIYFLVEQTGSYTVQLSVDDGVNDPVVQTVAVTAGTWVGAGIVHNDTSPPTISASPCTGCHALGGGGFASDNFTPWLETGHATMVANRIDDPDSHYSEGCLNCHTVGWDDLGDNGGFDDLLATSTWTFPDPTGPGSYQNLIDTDPDLAAMANIQCENCHGPASQHAAGGNPDFMSVSLDTGVCGQCHGEPWRHPRAVEWEYSGHSHEDGEAFRHWDDEEDDPDTPDVDETGFVSGSCAKCHSGWGYIEFAKSFTDPEWEAGMVESEVHTCATCHDPHSDENPGQLRVVDSTLVPAALDSGEPDDPATPFEDESLTDGYEEVSGLGVSATCITCHNGRRSPASMIGRGATSSPRTPHYKLAGVALLGVNGVEYGHSIDDSYHGASLGLNVTMGDLVDEEFGCITCHMAVSAVADQSLDHPQKNKVGQHSLNMSFEGFDNVELSCGRCHSGDFNRTARGDYDGDGTTEGIQDEVLGLVEAVKAAATTAGATELDGYPYWDIDDALTGAELESVKNALWNIEFVENDESNGVHNTGYVVGLLQATYNDLTGTDISSDLRYQ